MPESQARTARPKLYLLFSAVVTVAIMWYLFTHVTIAEVLDLIFNMDIGGLVLFLACSIFMSIARTWRYALILGLSGYRPSRIALFLVVIVRNFFSDLLPARIGTLIYVYLVTNRLAVPFGAAASSFALAFLFDIIALAPMIVLAVLLVGGSEALPSTVLVIASLALLAVFILILAMLPALVSWFGRAVARLPGIPIHWRERIGQAMSDAAAELLRARDGRIYAKLLAISILVRIGKYGSLYFLLFALLAPIGYTFAELPVPKVFVGLVAPELAASLPISGIGGFGAYEGAWALVFQLLGYPADIARLTAVSHHLFTQVYGYLLGALALCLLLLPVWRSKRSP